MGRRSAADRLADLHARASKVGDEVACQDVCWAARSIAGLVRTLREHCVSLGVDFSKKKQNTKQECAEEEDDLADPNDIPVDNDDRIPGSENKLNLLKPNKLMTILETLHPYFFVDDVWRALTPKGRRVVPKDPMIKSVILLTGWPESRTFGGVKSVHLLVENEGRTSSSPPSCPLAFPAPLTAAKGRL